MRGKPSINRLQARELEKKVTPSIKLLSKYLNNTAPDVPVKDFHGYKVPAGTFKKNGMDWQLQVVAVCTKQSFIKDNEIKPIIRKWAILFKLRLFAKILIDKIFDNA